MKNYDKNKESSFLECLDTNSFYVIFTQTI